MSQAQSHVGSHSGCISLLLLMLDIYAWYLCSVVLKNVYMSIIVNPLKFDIMCIIFSNMFPMWLQTIMQTILSNWEKNDKYLV